MNIFAVHPHPAVAARMLVDKHVVRMPLETAQIVSTALRETDADWATEYECLYKSTHENHPVVQWAGRSQANFAWTLRHGLALGREYRRRYESEHKSVTAVLNPVRERIDVAPLRGRDDFALAMPDEYKQDDSVAAYRAYYRAEKVPDMGEYTARDAPEWIEAAAERTRRAEAE